VTDRYQTLVPAPRQARRAAGTYQLGPETALVAAAGAERAADTVRLLLAPLRLPLRPASQGAGLVVRIDGGIAEPEGYRVTVTPDGIELAGSTLDGVRHATQALRQLLPDAAWRAAPPPGTRWTVECGEIVDAPALPWRGGMLDVSRHFQPKHVLLRYVDLFAMHRFNRLHLHLTDDQGWRIGSDRYPDLAEIAGIRPHTQTGRDRAAGTDDGTPHGGWYSLADLAEVSAYAADRGITLVPEIDLPGHASALLAAMPELGIGKHRVLTGWGISPGVVRPVPASIRFVSEILDEVLDAVRTPYMHLGGDECVLRDWPEDPEVAEYMEEVGVTDPVDMHGHFLRQLGGHLAGRDVRMVVWDEAFVTGGVLEDSIVTAWRGDDVAHRAAAAGYDVVRCPVYPTYFDYDQADSEDEPLSIGGPVTLDDVRSFTPLPESWTDAERGRVIGAQFQCWSEYIPTERHLDYMAFPRACALAEVAWNGAPANPDLPDRVATHLGRLDAAGVDYRPLNGPRPWQVGGTGYRRHEQGAPIARVRAHLEEQSVTADIKEETTGESA
jgi:hexosaminidase